MKTRITVVCAVVVGALILAVPAMAQSTINFGPTFHEFFGSRTQAPDCPVDWSCGAGEVNGLGVVTESIDFMTNVRTITFSDGSTLVTDETESAVTTPGQSSNHQPNNAYGHPYTTPLTDVVDGSLSTGIFAGASGTLTGEARVAGSMAIVTLSGQITLA